MSTVFWDRQSIISIDALPLGETINEDVYCEALKELQSAVQNKRSETRHTHCECEETTPTTV